MSCDQPGIAWLHFSLSVSIKDRSLHWMLGKSQTYYPERILGYERREDLLLLSWVPALSGPTDWRREWWSSKHHTESETKVWGLGVQVWTGTWTP